MNPPLPPIPRQLFDAIYEMNAAGNHSDFFAAVVSGLTRMIRTDICVVQAFDRVNQRIRLKMSPEQPFTQAEIDYYMAHPDGMPLVEYYKRTGDTRARRLCDVVDMQAWRNSRHYQTCLARQNVPFTLALPFTINATTVAAISFNRGGREFSKRDCDLLDVFAPHFRLAWSRQPDPWTGVQHQRAAGLTPREGDVLYWITCGKLNSEIATILGIRLSTVQEHVANILPKLKVENRHALTVLCMGSSVPSDPPAYPHVSG
jgi:DNA-binding CsgD family transcriptional regulator